MMAKNRLSCPSSWGDSGTLLRQTRGRMCAPSAHSEEWSGLSYFSTREERQTSLLQTLRKRTVCPPRCLWGRRTASLGTLWKTGLSPLRSSLNPGFSFVSTWGRVGPSPHPEGKDGCSHPLSAGGRWTARPGVLWEEVLSVSRQRWKALSPLLLRSRCTLPPRYLTTGSCCTGAWGRAGSPTSGDLLQSLWGEENGLSI